MVRIKKYYSLLLGHADRVGCSGGFGVSFVDGLANDPAWD